MLVPYFLGSVCASPTNYSALSGLSTHGIYGFVFSLPVKIHMFSAASRVVLGRMNPHEFQSPMC